MSDQTGIFGGDPATNLDKGSSHQASTLTGGSLEVLVGEGRKYKTTEDLAKSYMEADGFIEKLKDENRVLREQAAKAKTLEEVLDKLKQPAQTDGVTPRPSGQNFSAEDVAKIVKAELTGYETTKTRQNNLALADSKMKELFGDKAKEVFDRAAPDADTKRVLQSLAEVNPTQFLALFHKQSDGSPVASQSSVNTGALHNSGSGSRETTPGTKEYWNALRRAKPMEYYSQKNQLAMLKDAQDNPTKFFGEAGLDMSLGR